MTNADVKDVIAKSIKKSLHQFFETMCPMPVEEKAIVYDEGWTAMKLENYQAIGVIALTGTSCKGSANVHVQKEFGALMAKTMLGLETISNDSEIYDMVGELTNIVIGCAKNEASTLGVNFDISCPTVIKGNPSALVEPAKESKVVVVKFMVQNFPILIVVNLVDG